MITDWAMPIFDGIELTRMIRQPETSTNPYVPIIMVTGHAERRRVTEARDAGVTEFLVKPISAKALYQRIVSVVMLPRPFIKTSTYFGPCRRRTLSANYGGVERRGNGVSERIEPMRLQLGTADDAEPQEPGRAARHGGARQGP